MTILTGDFAANGTLITNADKGLKRPQPGPASAEDIEDDTKLYLRHVEGGETIRALAREAGCHASTILRRIRRFEARREDPLVDRALARRNRENGLDGAQLRRILRRMAEPGATMAVAADMEKAIVTRDGLRIAILDRKLAETMALNGWIVLIEAGRINRYELSHAGREMLRQMLRTRNPGVPGQGGFDQAERVTGMAEAAAPFDTGPKEAERHRVWAEREIVDPENRRRRARVNIAESPMLMLARRRGPDGKAFLTPDMVAAGERLREDFELASMGPRVAQNWDRFLTAGSDRGVPAGAGFGGGNDKARERVGAALRDLGPGMGDLVLRVCCFLEGIEMTERRLGWSARSGKVVLRLALMRLDRHYREIYGPGTPLIG